jgi:Tol biopolymer transport system component
VSGRGDRSRTSRWSAVTGFAAIVLLATACGTGSPATGTPSIPSAPSSSPSGPIAQSPIASAGVGRLPTGRIVFDRLAGSPEGDFLGAFSLGVDGKETSVRLPVANMGVTGAWSPDGTKLLVNAFTGSNLIVGTLDPTAATWSEIRPDGMVGEVECTDWTPDGTRVICGRGGPDPADDGIYTVEVATGTTKRLTTSAFHHVVGTSGECGGGEGRAAYSADGSQFAYIQQKCGTGADPSADEEGAIAVASADGSDVKVIVPFGGVRTHPGSEISWSPSGDLIAFGTQDGKLSVIRADGTGLRSIDLPQPGFVYGPAWSPDGKWLLVTLDAAATGQADLYVVAPDGSTMVRITDAPDVEAYTDWAAAP